MKIRISTKASRKISCIATGVFLLLFAGLMCVAALSGLKKEEKDMNSIVSPIIVGLISLAGGIWEISRVNRLDEDIAKIGSDTNEFEKARKKYLASRGEFSMLDKAINDKSFALNCGTLWKGVLDAAQAANISEQELINDALNGEIFRCFFSVISVGKYYTVYCGCRKNDQYVLKNSTARRIFTHVRKTDLYQNGSYTGTNGEFFVLFENDELSLAMRCADYFGSFILDAYTRAGTIAPGVIEYPEDVPSP